MLYGMVVDDNEAAAKRSLAVLTELWRRHVWHDARTVNVIGEAHAAHVLCTSLGHAPLSE